MAKQNHPYHLVDPSPWPVLMALAAFMSAMGFVFVMHDEGNNLLYAGALGMALCFYFWWRDVIREAEVEKHHNQIVQLGLRYGMVLFIASEVMFFVAWFWAFFDAALFPGDSGSAEMVGRTQALGGVWPPVSMEGKLFDPLSIPFLNTLILVSSGGTVTWAHHALREGNRSEFIGGLAVTIILGLIFTAMQAYEYEEVAKFSFDGGIYPSTFYMATGFHGFHVIVGTLFLTVCLVRAIKGHFTADHHFGFEAAAWYWHFVDVVWLFLYVFIYWWGS